jgi:hypothetical protein
MAGKPRVKKPVQHKTPCARCPFRKNTPTRGYLGGFTPDEFRWLAESDTYMPCHTASETRAEERDEYHEGVSYDKPDLTLPQCAGRAIYWANQFKVPRDSSLLVLPRDTEKVMTWPHEFVAYHKKG